ncbi:MAG: XdhC family protein [Deinococcales bacterium]
MEHQELQTILLGKQVAQEQNVRLALATVVRVRGNAYRREGAKMLIREDGDYICMLSGGCLEAEVVEVAKLVLANKQTQVVNYDLSEDIMWGLGIGCGGNIDILIEPLEDNPMLERWFNWLEHGVLGVAATNLTASSFERVLISPDGKMFGDSRLLAQIQRKAQSIMQALYPRAQTYQIEDSEVFFDTSSPAPELLLFGAGHDAIPLAAQAVALGWRVKVVDARAAFLTPVRFPKCELLLLHSEEFTKIQTTSRSFAIIMNHHLERDTEALEWIVQQDLAYVGVLGPKSRFEKMRRSQMGNLAYIRNPIGLDIGAESPDEVALAIMAELIAFRRGFKGGMLNGRAGRIHEPT